MHAALVYGPNDVRVEDVDEPELVAGSVKIRIEWAGICGTDLMLYAYAPFAQFEHPLIREHGPHVLGHELSGYVTEVAPDVQGIAVGDLVTVQPNVEDGTCSACRRGEPNICENLGFIGIHGGGGGFAEYIVAPAEKVFVLPEPFTPQTGALVEFLSVAWHAVSVSGAGVGSSAFVVGAGPIGLALVLVLGAAGVEKIIVSELSERRKALAAQLGAEVIDPRETDVEDYVGTQTNNAGVDVSFDASGIGTETINVSLAALRNGGVSVVVANFHEPVSVDLSTLMQTEKKIVGSLAYTRDDFESVIAAVADRRIDPSILITTEISLGHLVDHGLAHLLTAEGRETDVKILVTPNKQD
ncbi:alcohol dehydrogenase catalytic domain-containing protein [Rhodococcus opacus]|nr:alcohol dehydrogenase catalytic domain-containing protein [Rhodococcus opacus]